MDDKTTHFKNYQDLLISLKKGFEDYDPQEVRDLLFFLAEFRKDRVMPEDMLVYVTELPIEGLEVASRDKVSQVLVGGIEKYRKLKITKKRVPPIVVVKGNVRLIIVYGEAHAIEAYLRKFPVKAVVLDVEDSDPFEVFKLNELTAVFLVPLIQDVK